MTFEEAYSVVDPIEGWMCKEDLRALYDQAGATTGQIVEIGAYGGRSTFAMALSTKAHVTTIDPFADDFPPVDYHGVYLGFLDTMKRLNIKNVTLIKEKSQTANIPFEIDLLFIDGDHRYLSVQADIKKYVPLVKSGSYVLFHDYAEPSFGVGEAVDWAKDIYFSEYDFISGLFRGKVK